MLYQMCHYPSYRTQSPFFLLQGQGQASYLAMRGFGPSLVRDSVRHIRHDP